MARVLIGWELGANRGHIVPILRHRDALSAAGHEVSLAVQRIDALAGEGRAGEARAGEGAAWQAPVWPGLIGSVGEAALPPARPGDILARVGLIRDGALAAMIGAWDRIIAAARPDIVVADFAPALLCAARGRLPAIATGTGFTMPPPGMRDFPSLTGDAPSYAEGALLKRANADLARAGRAPVAALPGLFGADREIVAVLAELDPYRERRATPFAAPAIAAPPSPIADGRGDELFVYWPEPRMLSAALREGLRAAGVPVRLYIPDLAERDIAAMEAFGFAVERRAMGWDRIAARARMLLSHGGGGFTTTGLLVGLPQLVLHYDLEKAGNGKAVERLGCGAQAAAVGLTADRVAALVRGIWDDAAVAARSRAAAPRLHASVGPPAARALVDAVAELARG